MDAVGGAAPEVSALVEPKAIGSAGRDPMEFPTARETTPVVDDIEDPNTLQSGASSNWPPVSAT